LDHQLSFGWYRPVLIVCTERRRRKCCSGVSSLALATQTCMKTMSQLQTEVFQGLSEEVRGTRLDHNPLNGHNKRQPVGSGCDSPGTEVREIDDNRRCSVVRVGPWLGACSPARKLPFALKHIASGLLPLMLHVCHVPECSGWFENPTGQQCWLAACRLFRKQYRTLRGFALGGNLQFVKGRTPVILEVWVAPGAPETLPKR
jgi:hypothetical protein